MLRLDVGSVSIFTPANPRPHHTADVNFGKHISIEKLNQTFSAPEKVSVTEYRITNTVHERNKII